MFGNISHMQQKKISIYNLSCKCKKITKLQNINLSEANSFILFLGSSKEQLIVQEHHITHCFSNLNKQLANQFNVPVKPRSTNQTRTQHLRITFKNIENH